MPRLGLPTISSTILPRWASSSTGCARLCGLREQETFPRRWYRTQDQKTCGRRELIWLCNTIPKKLPQIVSLARSQRSRLVQFGPPVELALQLLERDSAAWIDDWRDPTKQAEFEVLAWRLEETRQQLLVGASGEAPRQSGEVDRDRLQVFVDGEGHDVTDAQLKIIECLTKKRGGWVQGPRLCVSRPDKTIKTMPEAVRKHVESHKLHGYRWVD